MKLKFVTGKPALLAGDMLVIGDLHIGIEYAFWKSGIRLPSQTGMIGKEITDILEKTGAGKIVFLGDIKHKVPGTSFQETREIPAFFESFPESIEIHVVPGNHDGNIRSLLPEAVKLHSNRGFRSGSFFFAHGHTWPLPGFLESEYLITGHEHPQIEFLDSIGYRFYQQAWVIADLKKKPLEEKYGTVPRKLPKLVLIPRFNRLSGGISMNRPMKHIEKEHEKSRSVMGPVSRCADLGKADAYLLDGTHLGKIGKLGRNNI